MKQNKLILVLMAISISLLVIILINLNLTGFSVLEDKQTEVIRLIEANQSESLNYVQIAIISSENVIAIQENLSNCSVLNYYAEPDIDIFEFNENEIMWILANRSSSLNVEIFYVIPINCSVLNGFYYVLSENGTLESYGISSNQTENPPQTQPQPPSGGGGSSGSGGGSSSGGSITRHTSTLTTNRITQASDRQEYNELKQKAEKEVKKIVEVRENPQANNSYILTFVVLIVAALGIIIFFIISFARKPD